MEKQKPSTLIQKEGLNSNEQGFSLVEVLLASAIFSVVVGGLVAAVINGREATFLAGNQDQARRFADEALQAARNLRDDSFASLSAGTHGLAKSGGEWVLSGSSDTQGLFTRELAISDVDSSTKQLTSTVTWNQNEQRTGSISLVSYLTDWLQTTTTPIGDWTNPTRSGCLNLPGNQNGQKIQLSGNYAYMVRSGGNPDFAIIDLTDLEVPVLSGSLSLSGVPSNIAVSGNYAYVTSNSNNRELQIIDISTPASPSVVGIYNGAGNIDANGVVISGTTAYVTFDNSGDDELRIIDVSTPASPSLIGSVGLSNQANEVAVVGTNVYVATHGTELQVVDASAPASPSVVGNLNLPGGANGFTVAAFTDTVVLGRSNGQVHVIDVSNPASPSSTGSLDVGSAVRDIALANNNTFALLGTDTNAGEFVVLDISAPSTPVEEGVLNIIGDINGIAYDATLDVTVSAGDENTAEFCIYGPDIVSDWTSPYQQAHANLAGSSNGLKVAISGNYAYVTESISGATNLEVVDISDLSNPNVVGSIILAGAARDIVISGNYAYVTSTANSQELHVVDISTPATPSAVGSYNAPGIADANGLRISGTTVYMTKSSQGPNHEFYIIDVTTPTSPSLIGSLPLGGHAYDIVVLGTNAFIATSGTELEVIDIATPSSPTVSGSLNLPGGSNAISIDGNGANVYVGRTNGEFHVIDITTPTSPVSSGSYNASDDVNDIALDSVNQLAFLGTNHNTFRFQVIDISTPSSPVQRGYLDVDADLNGVKYDATLNRAFVVGDSNTETFLIIGP